MTESSPPLVSVIIPCYNQANYLPEAVNSVVGQTHQPIEIVVIDDGSPDNVFEIVASYPEVYCVRQQNRGRSHARNAGFRASRGEYVVFLDADDRLSPNAIEAHLRCFSTHPQAGFVVGDIDQIASDGSYIYSPRWPVLEANFYEELLKVNHVANTIAVMFRRSLFDALGGFAEHLHAAEDYELLLRAARVAASAHHSTVVAQYRRHLESTSRKGALMLRATEHVMMLQLPLLNGDRRLMTAWREGRRYWREHFGIATVKQVYAHVMHGELWRAAKAFVALLWYVRGQVFVIPWKRRRWILQAIRHRLGFSQKSIDQHPSSIVGS